MNLQSIYIYIDKWTTSGWIEERWKTNIIGLENCYIPKWIYTNNSWHSLYMMIINCIYFFLICISFKFNGLSSIFFFGKSCSSSCWWKGWIRCPNPFKPIQLLPTKVLSMKSIQEKLFTNKNGWGFFGGFFFGSVIEMCKSGWNSQKFVEHLPALVYLRYVHL